MLSSFVNFLLLFYGRDGNIRKESTGILEHTQRYHGGKFIFPLWLREVQEIPFLIIAHLEANTPNAVL